MATDRNVSVAVFRQTSTNERGIHIMKNTTMPAYLYSPENCPCPRGGAVGCPNYRKCGMCTSNHHGKGGYCACEKDAMAEGYSFEELLAYLDTTEFAPKG